MPSLERSLGRGSERKRVELVVCGTGVGGRVQCGGRVKGRGVSVAGHLIKLTLYFLSARFYFVFSKGVSR